MWIYNFTTSAARPRPYRTFLTFPNSIKDLLETDSLSDKNNLVISFQSAQIH